jgi:hypothetical protein
VGYTVRIFFFTQLTVIVISKEVLKVLRIASIKINVIFIACCTSIVVLPCFAFAQKKPGFEEALYKGGYITTSSDSLICYAETNTPNTFDLTRLCGFVSTFSPSGGGYGVPGYSKSPSGGGYYGVPDYSNSPSGGSSSGRCNTADDIASDGSRCGGRASDRKPGGR